MVNVTIRVGNSITYPADCIVNSANKSLMRGLGVCGAIHLAAGINLQRECQEVKKTLNNTGLQVGQIITTGAHNLPHKYVIHTVGPKFGTDKISLLYDCYENAIKEAEKLQVKSISFPAISTGAHGVPLDVSARIVKSVLKNIPEPKSLAEINLFFLEQSDADVYTAVFED